MKQLARTCSFIQMLGRLRAVHQFSMKNSGLLLDGTIGKLKPWSYERGCVKGTRWIKLFSEIEISVILIYLYRGSSSGQSDWLYTVTHGNLV